MCDLSGALRGESVSLPYPILEVVPNFRSWLSSSIFKASNVVSLLPLVMTLMMSAKLLWPGKVTCPQVLGEPLFCLPQLLLSYPGKK